MRPILLDLPLPGGLHLAFPAYGTFLVLGMLAAVWISGRHGRTLGVTRTDAFDLGLWLLVFSGVVGARLLHVALDPGRYFADGLGQGWWRAVAFWNGGLSYYGGLLAGFAVLWFWARHRGLPYPEVLDFVAPLGALGLGITRVGCFLNGCCYGIPSHLPWSVGLPPGSPASQHQAAVGLISAGAPSLPVHPVQLYEAAVAFALCWFLGRRFARRRYAGELAVTFCLLYGSWRIAAELLRADAPGWRPGVYALTPNQWVSVALIFGAALAGWALRRNSRPPAPATP